MKIPKDMLAKSAIIVGKKNMYLKNKLWIIISNIIMLIKVLINKLIIYFIFIIFNMKKFLNFKKIKDTQIFIFIYLNLN